MTEEEKRAQALKILQGMAESGQLDENQMRRFQQMQNPQVPQASGQGVTYGNASQAEYLRERLEALEASGDIRPGEQSTLDQLRQAAPQNQAAIDETQAAYRGFQKELTFNLADEVGGAIKGAFNPDTTYAQERDMIRAKDILAEQTQPDAFSNGQIAGALSSTVLPGGLYGKFAQGANLGRAALTGAAIGGATEGAREFAGGVNGFQERMEGVPQAAGIGAGFGATVPLAMRGGGKMVSAIANRARGTEDLSARAIRTLKPAVRASSDAMAAERGALEKYLASLGDEGMPADIPGAMQSQAQGLASMQGRGGSQLTAALNQRSQGAGQRIQNDMDQYLTQPNQAFDQRQALATERYDELGPAYQQALQSANNIETEQLRQSIQNTLDEAGPSSTPALRQLLNVIPEEGGITPNKLHRMRSDLSGQVEARRRAGEFSGDLKQSLQAIDGQLDQLPGYADARAGYAANKAVEQSITDGQSALRGGRASAQSPEEFAQGFNNLSEAQQEGFRAGMRRDLAGLMGTARNDASAASGDLNKAWVRENMSTALGPENAGPLLNRVDAERQFANTTQRVNGGSDTAVRQAAREQLQGADPKPSSGLDLLTGGMSTRIRENVVDPLVLGPRRSSLNNELGQFYSAQGADRDRMLQAVMSQANGPEKGQKAKALTELFLRNMMFGGGAVTNIDPAARQ